MKVKLHQIAQLRLQSKECARTSQVNVDVHAKEGARNRLSSIFATNMWQTAFEKTKKIRNSHLIHAQSNAQSKQDTQVSSTDNPTPVDNQISLLGAKEEPRESKMPEDIQEQASFSTDKSNEKTDKNEVQVIAPQNDQMDLFIKSNPTKNLGNSNKEHNQKLKREYNLKRWEALIKEPSQESLALMPREELNELIMALYHNINFKL